MHLNREHYWRGWCQSHCGRTQDKQCTHHVESRLYIAVVVLDRSQGGCTFTDNNIGADGARSIADALKTNKTLTTLDLACTLQLLCWWLTGRVYFYRQQDWRGWRKSYFGRT